MMVICTLFVLIPRSCTAICSFVTLACFHSFMICCSLMYKLSFFYCCHVTSKTDRSRQLHTSMLLHWEPLCSSVKENKIEFKLGLTISEQACKLRDIKCLCMRGILPAGPVCNDYSCKIIYAYKHAWPGLQFALLSGKGDSRRG
jgi:hypothetical protein